MNRAFALAGCLAGHLFLGCAHQNGLGQDSVTAEFIGSTPAGAEVREFLGGLAVDVPCHSVAWRLKLLTNSSGQATFDLSAVYHIPARGNTNQSVEGPAVALRGTWQSGNGAKAKPDARVYRLRAEQPRRSLSFAAIGEHLLHLLDAEGNLSTGNGGWSYTLNSAGHAERPVAPSVAASAPDMSYKISSLATGAAVFAVFEGRSPCHGIARELNLPQHAGCTKVKWRVTLFQNRETGMPAGYRIEGTLFRTAPREGVWGITRGATTDLNAVVYQLDGGLGQPPLLLLKGDDNVLFFLNQHRAPMVGHEEFSYTLNRVEKQG